MNLRTSSGFPKEYVHSKSYILVVETDDLVRGLLEQWLTEHEYAVIVRRLSEILATRISDAMPQLIIVNVPHPRNARSLIQSLRQVYSCPVLVISARFSHAVLKSRVLAAQLSAAQVLPIPFTRGELLDAVVSAIA
jgi:DNA-binding response OmpR family regulator